MKKEDLKTEKEIIGWIAMDENKIWFFHCSDPVIEFDEWSSDDDFCELFNYTPKTDPKNWKESKQPVYV